MKSFTLPIIAVLLLCISTVASSEQTKEAPQPTAPPEAVAHWQDLKFGIFIHWGPVCLAGTELGHSRGKEVPVEVYDNLYKRFNPVNYNADEIVNLVQESGAKYIVYIARHHDGFCMFDTKLIDYNIMNTPFGRDTLGEMAVACHKRYFPFGIYDSVCDWWHPDFPLGSPKGYTRKPNPNIDRYEKYLTAQVEELMTKYGPLLTLWFDYPQEFNQERGLRILHRIRQLQPDVLINNRLAAPMGEAVPGDYDTPEGRVGNMQLDRPWETCMKLGQQWSYKPNDTTLPLKKCLHTLINTAGGGGNLLLNVGPRPDGSIEPEQAERLRDMGKWLKKYGESIYATRGGPFERGPWGATTNKGNTIYLHILDPTLEQVKLAPLRRKIISSRVLTGGTATVKNDDVALRVSVPKSDRNEIDTIVALELNGPAADSLVKIWDLEKLLKPPKIIEETDSDVEGVKKIIFPGMSSLGELSQTSAFYGMPKVSPGEKVPAMVLIESNKQCVNKWMQYGYAAIAVRDEGEFLELNIPFREQKLCRLVTKVIQAHSLIRSMRQVDTERTGLFGEDVYGGLALCITAGIDPRFRFAVSRNACGYLDRGSMFINGLKDHSATEAYYFLGLWDPAIYLRKVKMPMLWITHTNNAEFPLNSFQESSRLPKGPRTLSLRIGKPSYEPNAIQLKEVQVFADSIVRDGVPLPEVSIRRRIGLTTNCAFSSKTPIKKVELNYTTDAGPWSERQWKTIEPTVNLTAGTASGTLPDGAVAYFFNVIDSRGLVVSTDYYNVPHSAAAINPEKQ
ncbi:MAG: alpha-L-fucosidase [Pirellulales bacterium]|nr:alpha-L-fucosidase [Pirellulales bacterium]